MDPRKSEHLQRRLSALEGYLLSDFPNNLEAHDICPLYCMTLMLSENLSCGKPEEHVMKSCDMCIEQFRIFEDLKNEMENDIDNCESIDDKEIHMKKIEQYQQNLQTYIFYLFRGKYQQKKFEEYINLITDTSCVVVADCMMRKVSKTV